MSVEKLKGTLFRDWSISDELGRGADGLVYLATRGEEQAAVKIFFPEILKKNGLDEQNERLILQLELKGGKHHPNLVEIFDGGYDDTLCTLYLIMEYVPGSSLDKVIDKIPDEHIPTLIEQLAEATKFLESKDLFHRDIKPANIVISNDFSKLTLLDLGVVLRVGDDDDDPRLSGNEFVASLRYSPPEFVWRKEDSSNSDAWRAITFYQIGATLHDMIMKRPIFSGADTPRAVLYDSVKLLSPEIHSEFCPPLMIEIAKACLIKDWRKRLQFVKWEMFSRNCIADGIVDLRFLEISVKQARRQELQHREAEAKKNLPTNTRAKELWDLQNNLFLELRAYFMNAGIYPLFSASHKQHSEKFYELLFDFEVDVALAFDKKIKMHVTLSIDGLDSASTDIRILTAIDSKEEYKADWNEIFTVPKALAYCKDAALEVTNKLFD